MKGNTGNDIIPAAITFKCSTEATLVLFLRRQFCSKDLSSLIYLNNLERENVIAEFHAFQC